MLEKALKAGSAAIAKATTEVGSDGRVSVGSAIEEINKMADTLVATNVCKTRPEAISQVAKANPELYTKYKDEQKKR